jgi:hypothetical protein
MWGKLKLKNGAEYDIDDYRIEGSFITVLTAYDHITRIFPCDEIGDIEETHFKSGTEKKLADKK